jgi:hypothetical protein
VDDFLDRGAAKLKELALEDAQEKKKKKKSRGGGEAEGGGVAGDIAKTPQAHGADSENGVALLKAHPQGTRVMHPKRGLGTVGAPDSTNKRDKQILVIFDSGEKHRYSDESAKKLRVVSDR